MGKRKRATFLKVLEQSERFGRNVRLTGLYKARAWRSPNNMRNKKNCGAKLETTISNMQQRIV